MSHNDSAIHMFFWHDHIFVNVKTLQRNICRMVLTYAAATRMDDVLQVESVKFIPMRRC